MVAKDQEIARLRNELDKAQHEVDEVLESTKDIELQLEQDVLLAEEQLEKVRRRNNDLSFDIANHKERYAQAQKLHDNEMSTIQKELETVRASYTEVKNRLRDEESKHDDLERQERIVTLSYQDLENKYHDTLERNADLEAELESRQRIDTEYQRLKDEIRDLEAELAVMKLSKITLDDSVGGPIVNALAPIRLPTTNQNYKDKQYLTDANIENDKSEALPEGMQRPPSRLATSNSTRYIQSLSTTIRTLREKMRTARAISDYATVIPPRIAPMSSPSLGQTSTNLSPTSQASNKRNVIATSPCTPSANHKANKNVNKTLLARYLGTSDHGVLHSSLAGSSPRQCRTLPRPAKRQSISTFIASTPAPPKYECMTNIRSPNRRRSMLPSVATSSPGKLGQPTFPKTNAGRTILTKGIFLHDQ